MAEQNPEQIANKCEEVNQFERQERPVHRRPCGSLYEIQFGFVLKFSARECHDLIYVLTRSSCLLFGD